MRKPASPLDITNMADLREVIEDTMRDTMDADVGISELTTAVAHRLHPAIFSGQLALRHALEDLMKAYKQCNGEDHPAYTHAENLLTKLVADHPFPPISPAQQQFNAAALEIVCYGADIGRLRALKNAWRAL